MIPTLYEPFRHWSENGSVYILSDLHFDDEARFREYNYNVVC